MRGILNVNELIIHPIYGIKGNCGLGWENKSILQPLKVSQKAVIKTECGKNVLYYSEFMELNVRQVFFQRR